MYLLSFKLHHSHKPYIYPPPPPNTNSPYFAFTSGATPGAKLWRAVSLSCKTTGRTSSPHKLLTESISCPLHHQYRTQAGLLY